MKTESILFKCGRCAAAAMLGAVLFAGGGTISYAENPSAAQSQQNFRTVKGKIIDENGQPVAGAGVLEENTRNGVNSDIDGNFSLKISDEHNIVISFIGYETVVINPAGKSDFQIQLTPDSKLLNEVVVTALGIKRDAKALGYSVSEVKGASLVEARENNIMNSLSGKIAGLQVSGSGNGSMGSSRIIIRGNNSLAGNNEPLVVIDGVPMNNFNGGQSTGQWSGSDSGNGLTDVNPDDIESISVLKGAAASALYGTRAGNGVIMITTKKGNGSRKGLGVTVNQNIMFETPLKTPEMQNVYGQGTNGEYDANGNMSWGPKMEGQMYVDWTGEERPFSAYNNDITDFLRTGFSSTTSIEAAQTTEKNAIRASASFTRNKGQIPTNNQDRYNIDVRDVLNLSERVQLEMKVNYIKQKTDNIPFLTLNPMNIMSNYLMMPRNVHYSDMADVYDSAGAVKQWTNKEANFVLNPYFNRYNSNYTERNRLIGFISLQYKPFDWLTIKLRHGEDMYWTENNEKVHSTTPYNNNYKGHGNFYVSSRTFRECNSDFLVTLGRDNLFGSDFSASLNVGGNRRYYRSHSSSMNSGSLAIKDFFSMGNGMNQTLSDSYSRKAVNSIYGLLSLNYGNWVFLDVTGRNDWSSTLPASSRSFFYPSVGFGWVVTDMLSYFKVNVPHWLTFAKLRVSYAEVGNDTNPYRLTDTYSVYNVTSEIKGASVSNTIPLSDLKPENIKSTEAGFDIRLFDSRFGVDFAWYRKNATNQIISLPISNTTGKQTKLINAGDIENKGIEVALSGTPFRNKNFGWDITLNFTKNQNKINKLHPELSTYELMSTDFAKVIAREGGSYGDIVGYRYKRNEEGQKLVDKNGLPILESTIDTENPLGNYLPDWTSSMVHSFRVKDFFLSFQLDFRKGGDIYMGSLSRGDNYGTSRASLRGREEWYAGNGGIVAEGINPDGEVNTLAVNPQEYFSRIAKAGEEYVYDGTNLRLRELTVGYNMPRRILDKTPFSDIRISLWGRNLWMIYSHIPGYDPESSFSTGNGEGIELSSFPSTRSFGINVKFSF